MNVSEPNHRPPTDVRRHQWQTERNLIVGGFVILFGVGGVLIWLVYGPGAAFSGWLCMVAGVGLFGLLYLILKAMEWVAGE